MDLIKCLYQLEVKIVSFIFYSLNASAKLIFELLQCKLDSALSNVNAFNKLLEYTLSLGSSQYPVRRKNSG
jgi:hypothetical protein